jgi:hypothetical protein
MNHYSVQDAYSAIYGKRESKDSSIQGDYDSIYEEKDHEVSMIRAQLHSIQKSCESLMKHMSGEETNVEAWVQAKITTAADDLHAAANYIESGESKVNEATHNFVYGSPKSKEPEDKRMLVTKADKKANTKAYQNFKAGNPNYKAAEHLK